MTTIYIPSTPQIDVDSLLKRYDKKQEKERNREANRRTAPANGQSAGSDTQLSASSGRARSERRRNDPARAERRRQNLAQSYLAQTQTVAEFATPKAIYGLASPNGLAELKPWLPAGAINVFFGLCTLGEPLDEHMRELTEGDLAGAAILNEVALAWIVTITREMHQHVREEVTPDGCKVGAAYRPGLGRWPLQIQDIVFAELPTKEIGVSLTKSMLMLPSFSTSLVIPVMTL